jgi:hypothetical protein
MADKPENEAVYLKQKHGWFWVIPQGQRSIYYGPYATRADANRWRDAIDGYVTARDPEKGDE